MVGLDDTPGVGSVDMESVEMGAHVLQWREVLDRVIDTLEYEKPKRLCTWVRAAPVSRTVLFVLRASPGTLDGASRSLTCMRDAAMVFW